MIQIFLSVVYLDNGRFLGLTFFLMRSNLQWLFQPYIVHLLHHFHFPKPFNPFPHCFLWRLWSSVFHASTCHPCRKFILTSGIFAMMSNPKSIYSTYQIKNTLGTQSQCVLPSCIWHIMSRIWGIPYISFQTEHILSLIMLWVIMRRVAHDFCIQYQYRTVLALKWEEWVICIGTNSLDKLVWLRLVKTFGSYVHISPTQALRSHVFQVRALDST